MPTTQPRGKSPAERKAAERERHRAAGRVAVTVYVKPRQRQIVRDLEKALHSSERSP